MQAAHLLTATEVGTQHQGILDAIISGDPDAAAHLTRRHIEGARDALLAHVDGGQHADDGPRAATPSPHSTPHNS